MMTRLRRALACIGALAMALYGGAALADTEPGELAVLPHLELEVAPEAMLEAYLLEKADAAFDARRARFEALETASDVAAYQERQRTFFWEQIGGEPERTPLNAETVDTLERDGYTVEKIIFESMPGFHVTGLMFVPEGDGPHPAVLIPCGHAATGKAAEAYQRAAISLAKHGIAAFVYDPIGQGERYQVLDEEGAPVYGSTQEHTLVGVGAMLVGWGAATYRIWDGVRALDYLESREDVDNERIGCTGNSGGGTLTAYLMALDDRIAVAAPSCYITSFEELVHTIGPQDAEQNIFRQIDFGMEHADYLIMTAPRPLLVCAATEDFFAIDGTWDAFRQAMRTYTRLGYPERAAIAEADATHGFSQPLRESMVQWMLRWLRDDDRAVEEPEFEILSDEEATVTPDGQVLLLDGAVSAFDMNAERADALAEAREAFWSEHSVNEALAKVRELAAIPRLDAIIDEAPEHIETIERDGYSVAKLVLRPEDGIVLPALVFFPSEERNAGEEQERYLYIGGEGMAAEAGPDGLLAELALEGHVAAAMDVRGLGETMSEPRRGGAWAELFGGDWPNHFLAYLLGESYVGMRTVDILYGTSRMRAPVHLIASGEAAVPALHAAAMAPDWFASVELRDAIRSWTEVTDNPETPRQLANAVHKALSYYDLPDLERALPEGAVTHTGASPADQADE